MIQQPLESPRPGKHGRTTSSDSPDPKKRKRESNGSAVNVPLPSSSSPVKDDGVKKKKNAKVALPRFHFDTKGLRSGKLVLVKDIRDLEPQWMFVENKRLIKHILVLLIPGVTNDVLGAPLSTTPANYPVSLQPSTSNPECQLPIFRLLFSHSLPTRAPGDTQKLHNAYQTFIMAPLQKKEKEFQDAAHRQTMAQATSSDPIMYLLSRSEMEEQKYPIPTRSPVASLKSGKMTWEMWTRPDGWIETPRGANLSGRVKVLALDCEMCLTEDGSELARITVVDNDRNVVYDSLVKPDKPIIDYLTRWSGITPKALEGVTTRLVDVQKKLTELIDHKTILVGHSLDCDLRSLKLSHPWVIDTSVMYHHPRGAPFKPSLKWLAQKWLGKEIQRSDNRINGDVVGHDSEEDARTCVELLAKKLEKGPGFGEFPNETEPIFERLTRHEKKSVVVDHGSFHTGKATTRVECNTDEEVVDGILKEVSNHDFVLGRLTDLSNSLGWTSSQIASNPRSEDVDVHKTTNDVSTAMSLLNSQLKRLHQGLPANTALIIFGGHSDPRPMLKLSTKKANFEAKWKTHRMDDVPIAERWMAADDRLLTEETEKCRVAPSFYLVKH
ncbi:hypothetical protein BT69DRAFT_1308433 [Atractiella rhizophila]|nr:hypothetical protein BT69DRAFT_1308433 [Atractiella rhizophila]